MISAWFEAGMGGAEYELPCLTTTGSRKAIASGATLTKCGAELLSCLQDRLLARWRKRKLVPESDGRNLVTALSDERYEIMEPAIDG